eukprot:6104621-Pleurochrysis_carterae.AAC.6
MRTRVHARSCDAGPGRHERQAHGEMGGAGRGELMVVCAACTAGRLLGCASSSPSYRSSTRPRVSTTGVTLRTCRKNAHRVGASPRSGALKTTLCVGPMPQHLSAQVSLAPINRQATTVKPTLHRAAAATPREPPTPHIAIRIQHCIPSHRALIMADCRLRALRPLVTKRTRAIRRPNLSLISS